jgi:hypothetical protein
VSLTQSSYLINDANGLFALRPVSLKPGSRSVVVTRAMVVSYSDLVHVRHRSRKSRG